MKRWVLALVVVACGKETTTSTVTITTTPPTTKPDPAPVASAPKADAAALGKLAREISAGDGWKASVMKIVGVAGAPNVLESNHGFDWFAVANDECSLLQITPEGPFVKAIDFHTFETAADEYKPCVAAAAKHATLPALADPPKLELEAPARAIVAAWKAGNFQAIYDGAHPDLEQSLGSADAFAHLEMRIEPAAGKLVELAGPLQYGLADFSYTESGPVKFDKGTLALTLEFQLVDGQPKLTNFNLELPKELRSKPDKADAEKLARHALDIAFSGKFADISEIGTFELVRDLRAKPDVAKQIDAVARKFGKLRSVKLRDDSDCRGQRCIEYDLVGSKSKGTAQVIARFSITAWEIAGITLTPT